MTPSVDLPDRIREACAEVAARARHVKIDRERVGSYAATLPSIAPRLDPGAHFVEGSREDVSAFALCNNAINFGSGWWPTVRKRGDLSGYMTMASGLTDRFRAIGPWPADELARIGTREIADVLSQDPDHELMALYAAALRDLGEHVRDDAGGEFVQVVGDADSSAVALATRLATWQCFADVSPYDELQVPFFKRAQLTASDLHLVGVAQFADIDRLTLFADNLVPHVLSIDGVLVLHPELASRIERGTLLIHDSEEEVELRACAVHAVELLADACNRRICPAQIDMVLWTRGQQPRFKTRPRPRARTTAY